MRPLPVPNLSASEAVPTNMRGVRRASLFSSIPFILFLRQQCLASLVYVLLLVPSSSSSLQNSINGSANLPEGQQQIATIPLTSNREGNISEPQLNDSNNSILNSPLDSLTANVSSVVGSTAAEIFMSTVPETTDLNKSSPNVTFQGVTNNSQEVISTEGDQNVTPESTTQEPDTTSPRTDSSSTEWNNNFSSSPNTSEPVVIEVNRTGDSDSGNKTKALDTPTSNEFNALNSTGSLDDRMLTSDNKSVAYTDADEQNKTDSTLSKVFQTEPSFNLSSTTDSVKDGPFGSVVLLKNVSIEEVTSSSEAETNVYRLPPKDDLNPRSSGEEANETKTLSGVSLSKDVVAEPTQVDILSFTEHLPPLGNGFLENRNEAPFEKRPGAEKNITGVGIKATVSVSMNVTRRENVTADRLQPTHLQTNRISKLKSPEGSRPSEDADDNKDNSIVSSIQISSNAGDTLEQPPSMETTNRPQGEFTSTAETRRVNPLKPKLTYDFSSKRVDSSSRSVRPRPTSLSTDVFFPSTNESIKSPYFTVMTTSAKFPTSEVHLSNLSTSASTQAVSRKGAFTEVTSTGVPTTTEDNTPLLVIEAEMKIQEMDYIPQLGNRYSAEFKSLASTMHRMLTSLYSLTPLSSRLRNIKIDGFSSGSVIVDYILELTNYEDDDKLDLDYLPHMFNSLLDKSHSFQGFTFDPSYTKFSEIKIRTPKPVIVTPPDPPIPQWAIAVIVIGSTSLIFIILFGAVTIYGRNHENRRYATKLKEEDLERAIDTGNKGWDSKLSATYDNMAADDIFDVDHMAEKKYRKSSVSSTLCEDLDPYDSWSTYWTGHTPKRVRISIVTTPI